MFASVSTRVASRARTNAVRNTQRAFSSRPALTTLSEDEQMLQQNVRDFAKNAILPKVTEMDKTQVLDRGLLKSMFDQGYMGIEIPSQYNGADLSFMSSIIVIEELAKVDPAVSVVCDVQNTLVNNMFLRFGSEELKAKYCPQLAENTLASFCLSEPGSGSDAFGMKTKAEQDGDYYVLNGSKFWITNAHEAGVYVVMANADFSKGYKGITAFVVERDNPGLTVGKKEDKLGIRASSTCEVTLTDCRVHKSDIMGELGKGYKIAIETLNEGRIGIAAQMLGLADGAFQSILPYIHERKQFGQPIANFQGMQFQISECAADIEAARLLTYNAARLKESGEDFIKAAAIAKLTAARAAEKVSSRAVNMLGGVGFTTAFHTEKFFRDCKIGQIYEGTENIHLQTIAKYIQKELQ